MVLPVCKDLTGPGSALFPSQVSVVTPSFIGFQPAVPFCIESVDWMGGGSVWGEWSTLLLRPNDSPYCLCFSPHNHPTNTYRQLLHLPSTVLHPLHYALHCIYALQYAVRRKATRTSSDCHFILTIHWPHTWGNCLPLLKIKF